MGKTRGGLTKLISSEAITKRIKEKVRSQETTSLPVVGDTLIFDLTMWKDDFIVFIVFLQHKYLGIPARNCRMGAASSQVVNCTHWQSWHLSEPVILPSVWGRGRSGPYILGGYIKSPHRK